MDTATSRMAEGRYFVPQKRILIAGAALAGLLLVCACAIAVTAAWWVTSGNPSAQLVGKWHPVNGNPDYEFRRDGTGSARMIDIKDFRWHIEDKNVPVLVIESGTGGRPMFYHFRREGDTLTLTAMDGGMPPEIMRKIK